jgi:hypothetical protein
MEPEGSIPCSQEPSTGPYPEPYQSNPLHSIPSYLSKIHFKPIIITIIIQILILHILKEPVGYIFNVWAKYDHSGIIVPESDWKKYVTKGCWFSCESHLQEIIST